MAGSKKRVVSSWEGTTKRAAVLSQPGGAHAAYEGKAGRSEAHNQPSHSKQLEEKKKANARERSSSSIHVQTCTKHPARTIGAAAIVSEEDAHVEGTGTVAAAKMGVLDPSLGSNNVQQLSLKKKSSHQEGGRHGAAGKRRELPTLHTVESSSSLDGRWQKHSRSSQSSKLYSSGLALEKPSSLAAATFKGEERRKRNGTHGVGFWMRMERSRLNWNARKKSPSIDAILLKLVKKKDAHGFFAKHVVSSSKLLERFSRVACCQRFSKQKMKWCSPSLDNLLHVLRCACCLDNDEKKREMKNNFINNGVERRIELEENTGVVLKKASSSKAHGKSLRPAGVGSKEMSSSFVTPGGAHAKKTKSKKLGSMRSYGRMKGEELKQEVFTVAAGKEEERRPSAATTTSSNTLKRSKAWRSMQLCEEGPEVERKKHTCWNVEKKRGLNVDIKHMEGLFSRREWKHTAASSCNKDGSSRSKLGQQQRPAAEFEEEVQPPRGRKARRFDIKRRS
ncbi:hypothetical protein LR48_Vigan09g051600 [Vigna angularis]|uniref:Uncharacterized protein n=1 Tax=Phaseolus angularis TaxID=3914 RepID=A0A0L9VAA3_PHAAN|nr:hypothetical protein LR48_Vigan09g051600 [Vigna angularis]